MALSIVTEPTDEPVSLADMKEHLRIDTDYDDAYVSDCIVAARQWVEGQTKLSVATKTLDFAIDYGWPWRGYTHHIEMPVSPVSSVTSITYVDTSGASQTLASSQYTVAARENYSYIAPAYDVEWPDVREAPDAITVRFVAGFTTVPRPLVRAILVLATHYYEMRETAADAPKAVESLISPYRQARV